MEAPSSQFDLLKTKRFFPLFVVQFLGAFNDNVFKNSLTILITFSSIKWIGMKSEVLVAIATGVFILPFVLFSSIAGDLADKYEKSGLTRIFKFVEIIIMCVASIGFFTQNVAVLMVTLFLMGAQSAFFGPIKYGMLPELLEKKELIGGNALIEATTFLAILIGTLVGGWIVSLPSGEFIISIMLIGFAICGWIVSASIPKGRETNENIKINYNIVAETWNILSLARSRIDIFLCILGISWFWFVGVVFLSQFPTFARDVIGTDESVANMFLGIFSIGLGFGSLVCNRLLKGQIHATYVPLAALLMSLFIIDIFVASSGLQAKEQLIGVKQFLTSNLTHIRIVLDLLFLAIFGGVYIVPLYAMLQDRCEKFCLSRIIASNNIYNAAFMCVAAVATGVMFFIGLSVIQIFLVVAILNAIVSVYICKLLPDALIRSIFRWFLILFFRVELKGVENLKKLPKKLLIVANHTSFIDGMLLASFFNENLVFALHTEAAAKWWVKPFVSLVPTFSVDPSNPMSTRALVKELKKNKKVVIFPEGRITMTGSLMKIYEGPGMIADKADAAILPVRIDGAQYSIFSRLRGKVRISLFPKITLSFLERTKLSLPEELVGRKRRQNAGAQMYNLMTELIFQTSNIKQTLFQALLDAKDRNGGNHAIMEDTTRKPLNYNQMITRSVILGRQLTKFTRKREVVGIMLPNACGTVITFFAMQAYEIIPAMLNFSMGAKNLVSACNTAKISQVISSKKFIQMANLEPLIDALHENGISVVYLEDVAKTISWIDKIMGLFSSKFVKAQPTYKSPAVILFTSGSEGVPKAVVLTHMNLQANRYQLYSKIDFSPVDKVFNALPLFHSFGLSGGMLLPILSGVKVFFYPSPLHYRIIPELIYDTNSTLMFGTDTFLYGYARCAHPYDFYNLRYVFAGAEKLKTETKNLWAEKFGLRILEGYGATEASPVISTNTSMQNKYESVGKFVPGIEYRIEKVPGIEGGGELYIKGPNIMKGYMLASKPGVIQSPENGWYRTGDIVEVDDEGFIKIKGRVKRFAKIAGEMVSLTYVEDYISELWPDDKHAVIAVPDAKKGEQLVLFTERKEPSRKEIIEFARNNGISELTVPKFIKTLEKLPILATGKTNYVELKNTDYND